MRVWILTRKWGTLAKSRYIYYIRVGTWKYVPKVGTKEGTKLGAFVFTAYFS